MDKLKEKVGKSLTSVLPVTMIKHCISACKN